MKQIVESVESPDGKYKVSLEATASIFGLLAGFGPEYNIRIESNSLPTLLRRLLKKKICLGQNYFDTIHQVGTKYSKIIIIPQSNSFEVKKGIIGIGKIGSCDYTETDKYDYSGKRL